MSPPQYLHLRLERKGCIFRAKMFSKTRKPDRDLIERIEKLEKSVRDIRLDWDDTYEKFARLNQRLAKRMKDHEKQLERQEESDGRSPDNGSRNPMADRLLHPYGRAK